MVQEPKEEHASNTAVHGSKKPEDKPEYHFELTIILPPPPFGPQDGQAPGLQLGTSSKELVRELKALVIESPEGFWLGSFAFVRDGDEAGQRLGDWDEIGKAFEAEEWADATKSRAIRVVDVTLDEPEVRLHVLRLKDVLNGTSPALAHRVGFNRHHHDPTALAIDAGCSQYLALNAIATQPIEPVDLSSPSVNTPLALTNGDVHEEARLEELNSPSSPKKRKSAKSKQRIRQSSAQVNGVNNVEHDVAEQLSQALVRLPAAAASAETAAPSDPTSPQAGPSHSSKRAADPNAHALDDWSQDDAFVDVFASITQTRMGPEEVQSPLVRNIAVSPYSPPPQHLRMRGHYLYLTATTLEGQSLHITASSRGFYIDRTTTQGFDPTPRSESQTYSSLFSLLSRESPAFARALQARLQPLPADVPDVFANAAPLACALAAPWLVRRPAVQADQIRPQLSYLSCGQLQPEITPPTGREWNEEFITIREMPKNTINERLNRDRMLARLQSDFSAAAAKGVQMLVRGEVPPINPNEPSNAFTYLHNNILFVTAEDPQGQHAELGGDEAVRVTTLKDVNGVRLLNGLDLDGIHSIGTVIVDFQGERWVAQALLPGLLGPARPEESSAPATQTDATVTEEAKITEIEPTTKAITNGETETASTPATELKNDSNFKIIYGSSDTEHPEQGKILTDAACHEVLSKIAGLLHLEKHAVKDAKSGSMTELWLPMEIKGVLGTDGRTYLIDLYRLQPVDITWLEKDLDGPLLTLEHPPVSEGHVNGVNGINGGVNGHVTDSDSDSTGPSTPRPTTYPHHYALLRPQLLEKFREDELKRYLSEKVSFSRLGGLIQPEGEGLMEWQRIAREAQSLPTTRPADDADDGTKDVLESAAAAGHSVFEMSNFDATFNPNAFVERPGGPTLGNFPETDRSTKMVRAASVYLREFLLPDFVSDVVIITPQPHDGVELSKQMHDRGIPMRYLGYIAVACERPPRGLTEKHAPAARTPMAHLKALALNEMTFRAAKHVLRRLMRSRPAIELAPLVSHFLNCLVGDLVNPRPRADLSEIPQSLRKTVGEWSHLSVSSLRDLICAEIASRFRFSMPRSFFASADFTRPQLLREVASRLGIQLLLRRYTFTPGASTSQASRTTTVVPSDVINLVPIVHDAPHRAAWIDEHFEQGVQNVKMNQIAHGEGMINEALSYAEQVYGSVHPDLARKYHDLAVLYHSVATPIMRNVNVFEHGHALSSSVEERARSKRESGLENKEQMLEAKRESQAFFEHALRMARQSVIIAERCFGLDHADTLQNYIDLAILEHANDRSQLALFYCRHAMELTGLLSVRHHTDWSRIILNAAQIVQAWQGYKAAAPLFRLTRDITATARGMQTHTTATIFSTCAAGLANGGFLREAIDIQKEALAIHLARFGELDDHTKEAENTLDQLTKLAVRKEKGENERVARLARRMKTDEAHAREIIARSGGVKVADQPKEVEAPVVTAPPKFAHLDIDEIVKIIEGDSSRATNNNTSSKRRG